MSAIKLRLAGEVIGHILEPIVARIATEPVPRSQRHESILVVDHPLKEFCGVEDYRGLLTTTAIDLPKYRDSWPPIVRIPESIDHLVTGDIVAIDRTGQVRTLYRIDSEIIKLFNFCGGID